MDRSIQSELEDLHAMEEEHGCELQMIRWSVMCSSAKKIVESKGVACLDGCPSWLVEELRG